MSKVNTLAAWLSKAAVVAAITTVSVSFHPDPSSARTLDAPPIDVNGAQTAVSGIQRGNSVFVPVRGVFEKLGAVVRYSQPSSITATKNGKLLARMHVGSRIANYDGSTHALSIAPFTAKGNVMIPLRLVSEAAGATVVYQNSPRAIRIQQPIVVAQAAAPAVAPAATDAATATTKAADSGIPWWVWLLLGLVVIGIILALMRRKKDPIISTSSTGRSSDPNIKTRR